ncbi:hypothetical protein [Pectobacterium aroidearum]|jgi:5'(3')-deoxyribonucleotidase|uniref:hypothetical protein n=1 Tax=Pectobacterium aroidearum TaxID=1201031 RepID=UPI002A81DA9C|nr:hypothetical protein [Pectobacterium aroidearum]MDY4389129.1 hypothetical protein [Pectobacterium aroidearum]
MRQNKLKYIPEFFPFIPTLKNIPCAENDFIPELHANRVLLDMPTLFNEEMSVKTASTSDARQKRQK